MTEPTMRERLARAAANALYEKCGCSMEVRFPEDCSLDDVELARYEGLMSAVDAILAELREPETDGLGIGAEIICDMREKPDAFAFQSAMMAYVSAIQEGKI